jgi:hypothetical protein
LVLENRAFFNRKTLVYGKAKLVKSFAELWCSGNEKYALIGHMFQSCWRKGANIEHGKVFSKTNLSPKISGNAAAWEWLRLDVKTKKR